MPDELLADTLLEIRRKFGAVSSETQAIHGQWTHEGEVYRDELIRVFVDTEDLGMLDEKCEKSLPHGGSRRSR